MKKIKPIDMQHHREELRRSLLTSPHWNKKQRNIFLFWKGGEEIMKKNKFVTAGITIAVIAIAFVSVNMLMPKSTKTAYAEEVAQKSYQAVTTLTSDQQAALNEKVMGNPKELLEKAKKAKDLKVLTYDQFIKQNPVPPGGEAGNLKSLNFLQFTDTDGSKVVLGVNPSTNLPELVSVMKENPDKSQSPKEGSEKSFHVEFQGKGDKGAGFQSFDGKNKVEGSMTAGGENIIMVDGKKYKAPAGVDLSKEPPQIKVEGSDVYINGVKATPAE